MSSSATPAAVLASFVLHEHLDHEWADELVGFDAELPADAAVAVIDEQGRSTPAQVVREGGKPRVFFKVDRLPRLGSRTFRLVAAAKGQNPGPAVAATSGGESLEISNDAISLRLPATQKFVSREAIPGPILALRLGDGGWIGRSAITLSAAAELDEVRTACVESGPLWSTFRVAYRCKGEERYVVRIRLGAGDAYAHVIEDSCINHLAHWDLDVAPGLEPSVGFTHSLQSYADRPLRVSKLQRGSHRNLGAITLPNYGGIYVPDDYVFYGYAREGVGRVSVSGVNGGSWLYPAENQIEVNESAEAVAFHFVIKAGHREWCLGIEAHSSDAPESWTQDWTGLLAQRIVRRFDAPLDGVKEMTLAWDDGPVQRPRVMLSPGDIPALRERAARIPSIKAYVDRLDPALPGEYFRYHSGTWGDQDPNSKADPPTAWLVTGRREAAMRTKEMILTGLRHRLEGFLSPLGNLAGSASSYINLGRGMRPWIQFYDMVAGEGVFTPAEEKWFRAGCAFLGHKIADRDYFPREALLHHSDHPRSIHRTHWFPSRESDYNYHNIDNLPHNFHEELYGTAIMLALAFPGHSQSEAWLQDSVELLDRELTDFVFPCGAWIESATYTFYTMAALLVPPMVALRQAGVRDFFADERFKKIFAFLARLITADDPRCGHGAFPVLGDAGFPGFFAYVFNWVATLTEPSDPDFAGWMMEAWRRYGSQISPRQCQGLNYLDLLLSNDWIKPIAQPQQKSEHLVGMGALLLQNQGAKDETYFFIKCGRIYSHFHGDEGSFILNALGAPLMDEYGVQYAATTNEQRRHNTVAFEGREVYNRGAITTFRSTEYADHLVGEMPIHVLYGAAGMSQWGFKGEEGPYGWWRRHVLFDKRSSLFAIYDEIESPYATSLHLHCKADRYEALAGNRWHFDGRFGVDLEVLLLAERQFEARMEEFCPKERNPGQSPDPGWFKQWSINVGGAPGEHYAAVLAPHRPTEKVALERVAGKTASRVTSGAAKELVFLSPQAVRHAVDGATYEGRAGFIRVSEGTGGEAGEVELVQMHGRSIGAAGVEITGDGPLRAVVTAKEVRIEIGDVTKMAKVAAGGRRVVLAPGSPGFRGSVRILDDGRILVRATQ
ncbi:MAG: hypothetical protein NTW19_09320 [Planctomycetota bacterium]|nr:hypothetical protein [Planctomycetota bacterium]